GGRRSLLQRRVARQRSSDRATVRLFRLRRLLLAALLLTCVSGCGPLQDLLDQLAGKPQAHGTTDKVGQAPISLPSGPQLYCITNISKTLVVFDLTAKQVLLNTRYFLDLDPVGPWFIGDTGYYISRVDTTGAGDNALIQFDPKTAVEQRRLT